MFIPIRCYAEFACFIIGKRIRCGIKGVRVAIYCRPVPECINIIWTEIFPILSMKYVIDVRKSFLRLDIEWGFGEIGVWKGLLTLVIVYCVSKNGLVPRNLRFRDLCNVGEQ